MKDKKVYKTDYVSDFTAFFNELPDEIAKENSEAVKAEKSKYTLINKLRDNADNADSRIRLWEDF